MTKKIKERDLMFECPCCKRICDDEEGVEIEIHYVFGTIIEIWCSECASHEED